MRTFCGRARAIAACVGASALLSYTPADAACSLTLDPESSAPAWHEAATRANETLASRVAHDCASIRLHVQSAGRAEMTFVTTDGRSAHRRVDSPDEVAPLLDALLVTLAPEPSNEGEAAPETSAPASETSATPTAPVPAKSTAPPAGPIAPREPPPIRREAATGVRLNVSISGGARLGFSGVFAAPALTARTSAVVRSWEFGVAGEYDPAYAYLPGDEPPGFRLRTLGGALFLGRRESIRAVSIAYGVGFSATNVHEEANDTANNRRAIDFWQPRASVYVRTLFPVSTRWKAVFELSGDTALANWKRSATTRNDLPALPRWGLVLSAGAEFSAL